MSSADSLDDSVRSTSQVLQKFLEHLAETHRHRTVDSLATTELTLSQIRMLFVLREHEEAISVNALADGVGLSLAAAGRGVDRLVGLDLVDRREDVTDRRVKRLSLTANGVELLDDQFSLKCHDFDSVVEVLPEQVRTRLRETLTDVLTYVSPQKVTS